MHQGRNTEIISYDCNWIFDTEITLHCVIFGWRICLFLLLSSGLNRLDCEDNKRKKQCSCCRVDTNGRIKVVEKTNRSESRCGIKKPNLTLSLSYYCSHFYQIFGDLEDNWIMLTLTQSLRNYKLRNKPNSYISHMEIIYKKNNTTKWINFIKCWSQNWNCQDLYKSHCHIIIVTTCLYCRRIKNFIKKLSMETAAKLS